MRTLIHSVSFLTEDGTWVEHGYLIIAGERIEEITAGDTAEDRNLFDTVIDGSGKLVLPGLINTHGHAAMSLLRGFGDDMPLQEWLFDRIFPAEAKLTADDIYIGTQLGMLEMIETGTTTFTDMYYSEDRVAEAVIESGMRAVLTRGLIGLAPDGIQKLEEGVEFVKNYQGTGNGRITATMGPHAPYTCPPEYLQLVIKETEKLDVAVQIHLSETRREVDDCIAQYGKTPPQYLAETGLFDLRVTAAHCVHVSDEDYDLLAKHDVRIAHNPGSNLKLGSGIAPLPKMLSRGIKVGLGTDGAASNNKLDMYEEMRLAALLHKGVTQDAVCIPALTALKLATSGGAEALFLEPGLGTLAAGALADLQLIDITSARYFPRHNLLSHTVYSSCGPDVTDVFVSGVPLYRNREFLTIDAEQVKWNAERAMVKLRV